MRTPRLSLTTTVLAMAAGCGGRPAQTPPPTTHADAAAPDAGDAAPSAPLDATSAISDAAPPNAVPPAVDPEISRRWTWHPCGQLPSSGADTAAMFAGDGTMAVQSEDGTIRGYDVAGTRRPQSDTAGFLVAAPDGTSLAGVLTGATLELRSLGSATARFRFNVPTGTSCGRTYSFSGTGDYFLAHGGGPSCIWRATDAGFVAVLPGDAAQAAVRGASLVTLQARADGLLDVVTRDFGGNETSRVKLETPPGLPDITRLSPAGDRAAFSYPSPTLLDTGGHTVLVMPPTTGRIVATPAFTAAGDRVLLGDGVFLTADGTRAGTLPDLNRLGEAWPLALSADGRRTIATLSGRAGLFEIAAPGITAVLGPPLYRKPNAAPLRTLAVSRHSVLAVATGGVVFGIRLAPRFEDSETLWSIYAGDSAFVGDISDDGRWASAAGDNRALYSAVDGRLAWPGPPPPAGVNCFGTQMRISPKGNWAAGASYQGTMDVFALDGTHSAWSPVSVLPTSCLDAAAFSRDERTLATTTPALYRFDATAGTWLSVWSQLASATPPRSVTRENWLADVRFSPDEKSLLVSRCDVEPSLRCTATLYSAATGEVVRTLAELTAARPSFSPEGSWIVAGPKLLHLPSGDTQPLDPSFLAKAAVFTPDGDIVAGSDDGVLARYCRDP